MYLESYNKEADTTLTSSLDFIITGNPTNDTISVFMASLCDIGVNVKGVLANFNDMSDNKHVKIKYYDDIKKQYSISDIIRFKNGSEKKWYYKSCKSGKYTHGIIYNKELMKNCVIDYEGNKKYEILNRYINDKLQIPMTEQILKSIDDGKLFPKLNVWSKKPTNIKAYYVNKYVGDNIIYALKTKELPLIQEDMTRWDNINTINDYVLEFNKEIKESLNRKIKVRFNPAIDLHDKRMFDYKMKPYKGQVALIESTKRTLLDTERAIVTAQMGCGKTLISIIANDLYMKEKKKDKYTTLVVAPSSTLKKWKQEIKNILGSTVNVKICTSTVDYIRFMNNYTYDKPLYIITSKETIKLGYKRIPSVNYGTKIVEVEEENSRGRMVKNKYKIKDLALCPKCGKPMENKAKRKKDGVDEDFLKEKHFKSIKKSNYKCPNCDEVLWSATYQKTKKTSLVDYCHRKGIKFDSLVWDEFHNEKNIVSATGSAFGNILNISDVKVLLSGTMNNGNVSSIFPLLMRLIPRTMFKDGYTIQDMDKFIRAYGSLKAIKVIKDDEQRATARTMFRDSEFSEIAGVNPIVFTKYLSDIVISATMDDLGVDMVNYTEYPVKVEMEKELQDKYNSFSGKLKSTIPYNFAMYESSVIRHYINNPFGWKSITVKKPTPDGSEDITINIPNMDKDILLEKEQELIDLVTDKLKEDKKCLVFTDFTGGHSKYQDGEVLNNRLVRILKENDIIAKTLKSNIKPIERMEYIEKHPDVDVWVTNPILVKEGLDLVDYPVIIFYNFDFDPLKIQQASRRAWRSIQTVDCETYYFYYKDSIEEKVMKSITLKKMEMNAIEGRFKIDDFNIIKRTASALGKELYDCINISDSYNKLNENQTKLKEIKLHPRVEKIYNH